MEEWVQNTVPKALMTVRKERVSCPNTPSTHPREAGMPVLFQGVDEGMPRLITQVSVTIGICYS